MLRQCVQVDTELMVDRHPIALKTDPCRGDQFGAATKGEDACSHPSGGVVAERRPECRHTARLGHGIIVDQQ
jgi:hypothetical protein